MKFKYQLKDNRIIRFFNIIWKTTDEDQKMGIVWWILELFLIILFPIVIPKDSIPDWWCGYLAISLLGAPSIMLVSGLIGMIFYGIYDLSKTFRKYWSKAA